MSSSTTNLEITDLAPMAPRAALTNWHNLTAAAGKVMAALQEGVTNMHTYEDLRARGASHADAVIACSTTNAAE
jgi:hypothetical protein